MDKTESYEQFQHRMAKRNDRIAVILITALIIACSLLLIYLGVLIDRHYQTLKPASPAIQQESYRKIVYRLVDFRERLIRHLIFLESSGRPTVYGDHGMSYGLLQFQKATFEYMKKKAGMEWMEWKDPDDQVALARWMVGHGYGNQFSTYRLALKRTIREITAERPTIET
jgi:Transglycosylase SLT domain